MIPLTGDELEVLIKARDILQDKATRPETGGGLALAVHDGLKLLLHNSVLDVEGPVVNPPNPIFAQGDSPGSPVELPMYQDGQRVGHVGGSVHDGQYVGGPPPDPQKLPGVPFKPKYPTKAGESE